jgi:hypothetical protein
MKLLIGKLVGVYSHAGPEHRGMTGKVVTADGGHVLVESNGCLIPIPVEGLRETDSPEFNKLVAQRRKIAADRLLTNDEVKERQKQGHR